MPTVPTAREFVEALRDWGCDPYPAHDDWATWCRPGVWQPIGVIHHHTGGGNTVLTKAISQAAMLRMLIEGRPDLHGPLCQASPHMVPGTTRARVALVGWGKANHAGKGSSKTASRVKAGVYRGQAPGEDDTDGNPLFLGLEYLHPGRPEIDWPDALIDTGARAGCAFMEASGYPRDEWPCRQVEHREWTTRKIDRSWTGDLRAAVRAASRKDDDVTQDDIDQIIEGVTKAVLAAVGPKVWNADVIPNTFGSDKEKNPTYAAKNVAAATFEAAVQGAAASKSAAAAAVAAAEATGRTEAAVKALTLGGVDVDAVADAVADKLAARLKD